MQLLTLLAVALLPALLVPPDSGPPPMPFVDRGACPSTYCGYCDWTAKEPLEVHAGWVPNSTPTTRNRVLFTIRKGEVVTAMTGVVITTRPGQTIVLADATTHSASEHFPSMPVEEVALRKGDVLYLLTPRGEWAYKVWLNGRIYDEMRTEDLIATRQAKQMAAPAIEWWVQVRNARGQIGWTDRPRSFEADCYRKWTLEDPRPH